MRKTTLSWCTVWKIRGVPCVTPRIHKIVAIVGKGSNPTGLNISDDSMYTNVKNKASGLEKSRNYESKEEFAALIGTNKGLHHCATIFMLTPWLIQSVNSKQCRHLWSPVFNLHHTEKRKPIWQRQRKIQQKIPAGARPYWSSSYFLWVISTGKMTSIKFVVWSIWRWRIAKICFQRD